MTSPTHHDVLAGLRATTRADDAHHIPDPAASTCSRCEAPAQVMRSDRLYCVRHWRIETHS